MLIPLEIVKEEEYSELSDGIKDLLKESYHISEDEAILIMNKASERSEGLLVDYFPYVNAIQEINAGIRNTLDKHLKQVDQEDLIVLKMVNEAAVWHAFECIRRFYKNMVNQF
jgi:hypothetical protein